MGPILAPRWLIGAQVRAKIGKLTLLGGLRGTKLELKEASEAAKRALQGPRCAMAFNDGTARGVIFGPGGPPKVT